MRVLLAVFVLCCSGICSAYAQRSETGICSWYGAEGEIPEGWPTYCGNFTRLSKHTAHWNVPKMRCGARLRVTNLENGRRVDVTVNNKGPRRDMHPDRILDLTYGAFGQIADHDQGLIRCSYQVIQHGLA